MSIERTYLIGDVQFGKRAHEEVMDVCGGCLKQQLKLHHAIECDLCHTWQHVRRCITSVSLQEY